jgi:hypothetical protein
MRLSGTGVKDSLKALKKTPRMSLLDSPHVSRVVDWSGGIGQRLRSNLAPLFANITDAIDREERAERQRFFDLRKPFIPPGLERWSV